jgi:hypothetical protein
MMGYPMTPPPPAATAIMMIFILAALASISVFRASASLLKSLAISKRSAVLESKPYNHLEKKKGLPLISQNSPLPGSGSLPFFA